MPLPPRLPRNCLRLARVEKTTFCPFPGAKELRSDLTRQSLEPAASYHASTRFRWSVNLSKDDQLSAYVATRRSRKRQLADEMGRRGRVAVSGKSDNIRLATTGAHPRIVNARATQDPIEDATTYRRYTLTPRSRRQATSKYRNIAVSRKSFSRLTRSALEVRRYDFSIITAAEISPANVASRANVRRLTYWPGWQFAQHGGSVRRLSNHAETTSAFALHRPGGRGSRRAVRFPLVYGSAGASPSQTCGSCF
jgi:hypothetical protein